MKIIGITGPTGAGKTTALQVLQEMGAVLLDADAIYHAMLTDDRELKQALTDHFGRHILQTSGQIDRRKLAEAVYPDRLAELNAVTHPRIGAELDRRIERARQEGRPAVAIDAISLIESGTADRCDVIISVLAPLETRIRRIMARDHIDEAYARRRALAQPDDAYFRQHSTFVLENTDTDTPETFAERTHVLFRTILPL